MSSTFIELLPKLPFPEEMRLWDKAAINFGIPETMLMENAGRALCAHLESNFNNWSGMPVCLFMGGGNNGGDAACLARHLVDIGASPAIFHTRPLDKLHGACAWHTRLAMADGVPFFQIPEQITEKFFWEIFARLWDRSPAIIIDGLLGTGFSGELNTEMHSVISALNCVANQISASVVAIDVPSGLDAATGRPAPVAVKADCTVSLAAAKPGLMQPHARAWTGIVRVYSIGLPLNANISYPASCRLLDGHSLKNGCALPGNSYKNIYGHVLVAGGIRGMTGAAHLAAAAALRAGSGLVTVCAPAASITDIKCGWPEIMAFPLEGDHAWPSEPPLGTMFPGISALVVGPGFGREKDSEQFLEKVLGDNNRPPAVIDADALMIIGRRRDLMDTVTPADILTPHPGEAAALLGCTAADIQADRSGALSQLCELVPAVVILKGAATIVGQRRQPVLLCPYDIPQLAIGGAGDVLAGCAGALLARCQNRENSLTVAGKAVAMHAMAGLSAVAAYPCRGLLASGLADALANVHQFLDAQDYIPSVLPWPSF